MNNQCQIQLCRLCLLEKGSYAAIYEANESFGFHIAEVINELLELDVSPGDGLPDNVCHDCLEEVARFKRFKNVCHEAKYTYKHLNILNDGKLINIKVEAKEDDLFEAVENEINSLVCIKSEPTEIAEEEYQAKVVNVCSITHAEYEQHGINYMVKAQPNDHIDQNLGGINRRDGLKCPIHYQVCFKLHHR